MTTPYLDAKYGTTLDRARTPAPIEPTGPSSIAWASILGLTPDAPIVVNEATAGGLPALDFAMNRVGNSVATMMTSARLLDANGNEMAKPPVLSRPHPILGAHEFYAMAMRTLLMRGNFVAIVVGEGEDAQLVPVHPDHVTIDASSGLPRYHVMDRVYTYGEVLHVRANVTPGSFVGVGIVEKFRRSLSEHLHEEKWGEDSYKSGGVPSGILKIKQSAMPTQDQVDAIGERWMSSHGGGRKFSVLPEHLDFQPLSWNPKDAEFVAARTFSVSQAAHMLGLRPEDLGTSLGEASQYANRSDDSIQRITDSYQPWAELLEQAFTDLVGIGTVEANAEALMRSSLMQSEELESKRLDNEIKRMQIAGALPLPSVTPTEAEVITS